MRVPFAYLLSACFHGSLLWLIASADDLWLVDYAVRSGHSGAPGAPGGQQIECLPDSQITQPEPSPNIPVTIASESPPEPATPSPIDGRVVHRAGAVVGFSRRAISDRAISAAASAPEISESNAEAVSPLDDAVASLPATLVSEEPTVPATEAASGSTAAPRAPAPSVAVIESVTLSTGGGGTGAAGAQVDQPPGKLPTNPEPVYPEDLRRQRIGGTVLLRVVIRADGSLERVTLEKSSGYTALDDSALAAVNQWRFQPARRGTVATRFEALLPITFAIRSGPVPR
jgi:protein TonB